MKRQAADKQPVLADDGLYQAWLARDNAGHHDQNLEIVQRLLLARPDDPDLHLLLARTLLAVDRFADSLSEVYRAIELGGNDAGILARAANMCFYEGDLGTARECTERAKSVAPRGFPLKEELKELGRNLKRREKGLARERRLSTSFDTDPSDPRIAADLARHLIRTGRNYAAYYVVARGLHYHPEHGRLARLERKLSKIVPKDERSEAQRWAGSGESRTLRDLSEATKGQVRAKWEAERRQGES
jgi:Flp pilus assembly protein TadD